MIDALPDASFQVIEIYRNERFTESDAVKVKSSECRFWIARKI